jgi:hypothetical protein
MVKISKDNYKPDVGDYLVWYMPFGKFENGTWQKAFWNGEDFEVYGTTLHILDYKVSHWEYLPVRPPKEECQ